MTEQEEFEFRARREQEMRSVPMPDSIPQRVVLPALMMGKEGFGQSLREELRDKPLDASLAAFGTAASDLYQGGKQLIGMGDNNAIEANKIIKQESPASALAGNVGMYATGGVLAPVLNTMKGATIAGAGIGALSPTENDNIALGKIENAAKGAAFGYAGKKIGQLVGKGVSAARDALSTKMAQNATKDASYQAARAAGYDIPASVTNPSWINRTVESLAGKNALQQSASVNNSEVTQNLARKALGFADDVALSPGTLAADRAAAGKAYGEVAAINAKSAKLVEALKEARFNKNAFYKHYNVSADPKSLKQAEKFGLEADAIESSLESMAIKAGKPDLVAAMRDARQQIAKNYSVDAAMNPATGSIDAMKFAQALRKDAPLTGELKQIAEFASAAPKYAKTPESIGGDGVSKLKFALATILGSGGAAAGGPIGATAGALPFVVPDAAKALALSKGYQSAMGTPSYNLPLSKKLAEALLASRYSPMAITGATVPALAQ